ncbi:Ies2p [Rhizophagus irregularis DAOM 197198w]|uniref:Ies2p n=1 Tax=Rhizophagus irregularis (strain DAOM 197198w) TaxID=1432141 RepID=A0A015LKC3_RHIIW|nr:Ies2p [Rhizophagus irregularis DAOM 197198w]
MVTSSRRPSTRRSTSLYSRSRQEIPPKVYGPPSDVSELESDESVPSEEDEEERNKLEDATYQSEEDEMDEEQDMMEEELEEEEEENEQVEEPEEDIEGEIEQIDDIDVEVEEIDDVDDATPVDDEEDFEAEEEESDEVDEDEDEEEDEEQSDYEEEVTTRKTRGGSQRSQQGQKQQSSSLKGKLKIQPEKQPSSRKRGSIAEPSSYGHQILTKRQRAKLNENYQQDLLQLPMEPMKKKHMTEEEIALKKSEIARRRKHQSIQRAEQDKMDTINRLLKKQTTKRRTKDQEDTDSVHNDTNSSSILPPSSFHYVNNAEGATLSIPAGVEIPIRFGKGPKYPPPIPDCAFPGCNVPKKYRSVKTFEYACSMDHLHKLESRG